VARVFDWNQDGFKDLVLSSSDGVYWCPNTQSNNQPLLQQILSLRAPVSGLGLAAIDTDGCMCLDLSDWNNDGVIDLLLGNGDGSVCLYEGYRLLWKCPSMRMARSS